RERGRPAPCLCGGVPQGRAGGNAPAQHVRAPPGPRPSQPLGAIREVRVPVDLPVTNEADELDLVLRQPGWAVRILDLRAEWLLHGHGRVLPEEVSDPTQMRPA